MNSFWKSLPRPFTILAPMDGVTDFVFREIINEIGRPTVFFTEFANVEGLTTEGFKRVSESLKFNKNQKPIVAQIWGIELNAYKKSAGICNDMGFSGIDINMGCPDRVIVGKGCCAALIKNPNLAEKIINSTKKGAKNTPISVKTRLGYNEINLGWIEFLLNQNLEAISIHLRSVSQRSLVPAQWDIMPEIIKLRDKISPSTLIIGNGDLMTYEAIETKFKTYNCDGFMVGRGIFQNPWFFNKNVDIEKISIETRINLYLKHINLFDKTWKDKNFAFLKKFCKTYINNFQEAAILREKVMNSKNITEMKNILENYKIKITLNS